MKIGISACLAGYKVRYDGKDKRNDVLLSLLEGHEVVPVCPELLAGLPIPHDPLELKDGKALTAGGEDVSEALENGCALSFGMVRDCDLVILKSKSPSCGPGKVFDGTFSGKLVPGNGLFAQRCADEGLRVFSDEDLDRISSFLNA